MHLHRRASNNKQKLTLYNAVGLHIIYHRRTVHANVTIQNDVEIVILQSIYHKYIPTMTDLVTAQFLKCVRYLILDSSIFIEVANY